VQSRRGDRVVTDMQQDRFAARRTAERSEGSLLASLQELRAIEEQRLADERAAVVHAAEQRERERAEAERLRREAAEVRVRAEQEAALAREHARLEAEREARLRIEAAEAAERARLAATLEQERVAQELELRRAEVARKRPTWMVAVTSLAVAGAAVLAYISVDSMRGSEAATVAKREADARAALAKQEAEQARATLAEIERENREIDGKIKAAIAHLDGLQRQGEIDAANKRLRELEREKAIAARRAEDARREAERKKRADGHKMTDECANNAICRSGR
jgi:hypothetical protein